MPRNSQRGQTLPVVLVVMTLLFLLAGGVTMAISAVLKQQAPNRAATTSNLASQNAVAAAAANVSGNPAVCGPPSGQPATQPLFNPDFQSYTVDQPPPDRDWSIDPAPPVGPGGPGGQTSTWQVIRDPNANGPTQNIPNLLVDGNADPQTTETATAEATNLPWSNYSVRAEFRPAPNTTNELDASVQTNQGNQNNPSNRSRYVLRLQQQNGQQAGHLAFGRSIGGQQFTNFTLPPGVTYQPSTWQTLEIDIVGDLITAKLNGRVLRTVQDVNQNQLGSGTIAVASNASLEVRSVVVKRLVPIQAAVPVQGGPTGFYCQRIDNIQTTRPASGQPGISEQHEIPSQVASCSARRLLPNNVTITIASAGPDVKVWLSVAGPDAQSIHVALVLTTSACPTDGDPNAADCRSNQQATPALAWNPAVTVIAADCTNPSLTQMSADYSAFLIPTNGAALPALPPLTIRWAPAGQDSVYMTVMPTGTTAGSPYEEADFEPAANSTALSYEGPLG